MVRRLLLAALLMVAAAGAAAQARFSFDAAPGRLSKQVVPSRYALALDLDPKKKDFGGRVQITLDVRAPQTELVLNAHELRGLSAQLDGTRALRIEPDEKASLWRLKPQDGAPIAAGTHTLALAYRGLVHDTDQGLYRVGSMLATQLEDVHARQLFPGFDEPAFRAVFEISVRAPHGLMALSNMPERATTRDGRATLHRFAATPAMPSYLVAVSLGRFDVLQGEAAGVPLRIFTAPGKRAQAQYAMGVTQQVLPFYNAYFGIPYALPKLDQIAVPGVRDGAMEDWGLISYIEPALLVDSATSGPDTPRWVYSTVAHEIAHQWFGNLVTASSWDEIWLNEAFATWLEQKTTDHFNPTWRSMLHERPHIDRAMVRDATAATRAIRGGPVDESKVTGQFDDITYVKGGAVLSMLEQWLGPEVFQRGLAAYMQERKLSNATAGDLWFHLGQASGRDVAAVASSWTDQPGYPVVQVTRACRDGQTEIGLAQQRFALNGALSAQQWKIPVRLRLGEQASTVLLESAATQLQFAGCSDAPLVVNAGGRGYYRVSYDAADFQRLSAQLAQIDAADAVTLLSDSFALAQAGRLPMGDYLALLRTIPQRPVADRAVLYAQADEALEILDDTLVGLPARAQVRAAARALFAPELARLTWSPKADEDAETAKLRALLIRALARSDDTAVAERARTLFDDDLAGRRRLPASIRSAVVAAVGMHADTAHFNRLRALLRTTRSEEDRWMYGHALGQVGERAQAETLLADALAGSLPPNIATDLPGQLARGRGGFGDLAYAFTLQNWEALAKLAGPGPNGGSIYLLPRAAEGFGDAARAQALLADQAQRAGEAGEAAARTAAARIELRAAIRGREIR